MIIMDKKSKALLKQIAKVVSEQIGADPDKTETALTQKIISHVEEKSETVTKKK